MLEYAVRDPRRYAFIAGLSGALIDPLETPRAPADLQGTPVLVSCAEHDLHIPLAHVEQSARQLEERGAAVTKQLFPGGAHRLYPEQVAWLQEQVRTL